MKIEKNVSKRVVKVLYTYRREMRLREISETLGGLATKKISWAVSAYLYPKFVKRRYSMEKCSDGRKHRIVHFRISDNPKLLKAVKEYLSKQDIRI